VSGEIDTRSTMPHSLEDLLRAASRAEKSARESQRRTAFRTMRYLLAGARANGFLYAELAEVLGVTARSIRNRIVDDGPITAVQFAHLASVSVDDLTAWHDAGLLGDATTDPEGHTSYLASRLIHAVLTTESGRLASSER
jgi:hypothetical protein